jgi:hypothetical protein
MESLACFSMLTCFPSFAGRPFTLHSWLSLAELLILSNVIYAVGTRLWRKSKSAKKSTPTNLPLTRARFGILALRSAVVRLRLKYNIIPTWTEEKEARNIRKQLEQHIYRKPEQRGFSRILSGLLTMVLVGSWAGWGLLALHDYRKIRALEQQLRQQEQAPAGLVIMHHVQVLARTSESTFRAQVENPATGEWTEFDVKSCPGHPLTTMEIQAGVTLPLLQYWEDPVNGCDILDGRWGGYTLLRNEGVPILTAFKEKP